MTNLNEVFKIDEGPLPKQLTLTPSQAQLLKDILITAADQAADYEWGPQDEQDIEQMIDQLGGRN